MLSETEYFERSEQQFYTYKLINSHLWLNSVVSGEIKCEKERLFWSNILLSNEKIKLIALLLSGTKYNKLQTNKQTFNKLTKPGV